MKVCANLFAVFLLFVSSVVTADEGKEAAAKHSALEWLALVDRGEYEASWIDAASIFKSHVSSAKWTSTIASLRGPLGAVIERHLLSAQYAKKLPGVPDGEYVVLQFKTTFADEKEVVETVTPMLEGNQWRVSGYYLR